MTAEPLNRSDAHGHRVGPGDAGCYYCGRLLEAVRVVRRRIGGRLRSFCCQGCAFMAEQIAMAQASLGLTADRGGMPAQRALSRAADRVGARESATADRGRCRIETLRLAVAWGALVPVMALAIAGYRNAGPMQQGLASPTPFALFAQLAQFLLTVPAVLFSAAPLWRSAAGQLRTRQVGMDVPLALGLAAAWSASIVSLWCGRGDLYFDSVTLLVALPLSARGWLRRALRQAGGRVDPDIERGRRAATRVNDPARPRPFETAEAGRFALVMLGASALCAIGLEFTAAPAALRHALAVLVISCPCALSLAAPLAMAVARGALARRGTRVMRASALEDLAHVHVVALDPLHVLIGSEPELTGILAIKSDDATCLRMAASLQAQSGTPFARALMRAAQQAQVELMSVSDAASAGAGVEGTVGGRRCRLGSADYALALGQGPAECIDVGASLAGHDAKAGGGWILADADGPIAIFRFGAFVRAGAAQTLSRLARDGKELLLLSCEPRATVQAIARSLLRSIDGGVGLQVHADLSCADKRALLAQLQRQGRRVAMIGDGIADATALDQADGSIALACEPNPALARADFVCAHANIEEAGAVLDMARRTARVIKGNLLLALVYTAAMLPLAVAGWVAPPMAAAGIAASSALALVNSLRLRRPETSWRATALRCLVPTSWCAALRDRRFSDASG